MQGFLNKHIHVHKKFSSNLFHIVTREETFSSSDPACPPAGWICREKKKIHIRLIILILSSIQTVLLPLHLCFFCARTLFDEVKHIIDLKADFVRVLANVLIQRPAAGTLRCCLRLRSRRRSMADASFPLLPMTKTDKIIKVGKSFKASYKASYKQNVFHFDIYFGSWMH